MAYFAPYIDEQGLHIPTYSDIRDDLIQNARNIFGQDIYLGVDSQDYQWISVVASKINDTLQAIQFAYDSRGPGTAIGSGLDILVRLNGITRDQTTYSTCVVKLTGTPNTIISNGVAQDSSNYYWNLPPSIMIGTSGTVNAMATCQTPGPITANLGDICIIATPTYGWATVTNALSATPGVAIETDSRLKARQAISTSLPSLTVLEGTKGAIAAVKDVVRFEVYENDTNVSDVHGLPAHSITAVVEGGLDDDVAHAIFKKKGPGCYTNGTVEVDVADQRGQISSIRFFRPNYVDVDVVINVKQLAGYTTQTTTDIQISVANYLNDLSIGDGLPVSSIWGSALSVMPNLSKPRFSVTSVTVARHGGVQGSNDIALAFNEVTRGNAYYVTVNVS